METINRHKKNLINFLEDNLYNFGFYQLLRIIENDLSEYEIKFTTNLELGFPCSDVETLEVNNRKIILKQNLMNLLGHNAILPDHFTELLQMQTNKKDYALLDFINIFTSPLLALYYNAWKVGAFFVNYEKNITQESLYDDHSISLLSSLIGIDTKLSNSSLATHIYLHHAGPLSQKVRSKEGLENLLIDFFELPISIFEFDGEWLIVAEDERSRLTKNNAFNQLGIDSMLGNRVWQIQHCFRIIIGPLDYLDFLKLLPNTKLLNILNDIVIFYAGSEYNFNIEILINSQTIPFVVLSCKKKQAFQLGWNSWLGYEGCKTTHSKKVISLTF